MTTETLTRPKAKEPWEMTLKEFGAEGERITTKRERELYRGTKPSPKWIGGLPPGAWQQIEWARTDNLNMHYSFVRQALEKGKPVPAKVLKDYPELQRSIPKVVTVSKADLRAKHPNRLDIRRIDTPSRARRSRGVYADKGQSRMSRKPHRNWRRIY